MIIKIVTTPATEGISITGARIFLEIPMPLMPMMITEAQINSWLIMITILGVCLFLTNGLHENRGDWRQMGAEWLVEKMDGLVGENMDPVFHASYAPFVGAVMALSVFSSLMSLFGVYPPTSDLNVVGGWAILVFILITKNKLKAGIGYYAKGYLEPIPVMLPMNIISEVATPVSMAFRHFGNVLSGSVISALVAWALAGASSALLGRLPGILGEFPLLRIGLPAVLSAYFDVFSGCIQAFIFSMLTMLYISGAYPGDELEARKARLAQQH
ncbi:MAG: F0F1 ATP synthase subunit A [Clostridiales bacterium]|nr:F0F1 ATP synthase subunit A [Clostridiales bacterium]